MSKSKELVFDLDGELVRIKEKKLDPTEYPLWYKQLFSLDGITRKRIVKSVLSQVKDASPETFKFLEEQDAKLVGVIPRVEYSLMDSKEGELGITWVHGFSQYTFLFWCEYLKIAVITNPVLEYDDSVLNKIEGNKKQNIKGFTG